MSRLPGAPTVGVLALQGGVAEHIAMVEALGARAVAVREPDQLAGSDGSRVDALILPGGESSAISRLLDVLDLREPLRSAIGSGVPTLGTCAGLILLAARIHDPAPGQRGLGLLDVEVGRNAFGSQLASAEGGFAVDGVRGSGPGGLVRGALIRAPEVRAVGPGARAIATSGGRIVAVTSADPDADARSDPGARAEGGPDSGRPLGTVTGVAFHPELSGDPALHRALLARAAGTR